MDKLCYMRPVITLVAALFEAECRVEFNFVTLKLNEKNMKFEKKMLI